MNKPSYFEIMIFFFGRLCFVSLCCVFVSLAAFLWAFVSFCVFQLMIVYFHLYSSGVEKSCLRSKCHLKVAVCAANMYKIVRCVRYREHESCLHQVGILLIGWLWFNQIRNLIILVPGTITVNLSQNLYQFGFNLAQYEGREGTRRELATASQLLTKSLG